MEGGAQAFFGFEESIVTMLGVTSGVAVGSGNVSVLLLSGLVVLGVQAVSLAFGSYLASKNASDMYEERLRQDASRVLSERVSDDESLQDFLLRKGVTKQEMKLTLGAIGRERKLWLLEVHRSEFRFSPAVTRMPFLPVFSTAIFYALGGLLTLAPYFFLRIEVALPVTIIVSSIALFLMSYWKAKAAGGMPLKSAMEMVTMAFGAALLGIFIGKLFLAYGGITF